MDHYLAIQEKWSSRELERQLRAALFEHTVLPPPQLSTVLRELRPQAAEFSDDIYSLEFLDLPSDQSEADLHRALLRNLPLFQTRDLCGINNPDFNSPDFEGIRNEAGRNSFLLSPNKWIDLTGAKRLKASAGQRANDAPQDPGLDPPLPLPHPARAD